MLNHDRPNRTLMSHAFCKLVEGVDATPDNAEEIVVYCRLSHRASFAWVAMTHILGFENVKIYDGSWTEWGSIVGFPVEK